MRLISDDALGVIAVFMEAEGEPYEGKVGVAEVIQKRTRNKFMSDGTVAGTVLKKYQFSGFNSDAGNRIRAFKIDSQHPVVQECQRAWEEAKAGSNLTGDALHYYNPKLCDPLWAQGSKTVVTLGDHRFVIPKERT